MNMKIADTSAQYLMLGQANRKNRRIVITGGLLLLIGVAVSASIYVADVSMTGLVMERSAEGQWDLCDGLAAKCPCNFLITSCFKISCKIFSFSTKGKWNVEVFKYLKSYQRKKEHEIF